MKKEQNLEDSTKQALNIPIVSGSNSYGDIILNTSKDLDCCSQCKYKEFNGEHNACFLCANEDIGINYYYR